MPARVVRSKAAFVATSFAAHPAPVGTSRSCHALRGSLRAPHHGSRSGADGLSVAHSTSPTPYDIWRAARATFIRRKLRPLRVSVRFTA